MGRISYSQLSMFSECPLRWKLNYIDKVTELLYERIDQALAVDKWIYKGVVACT